MIDGDVYKMHQKIAEPTTLQSTTMNATREPLTNPMSFSYSPLRYSGFDTGDPNSDGYSTFNNSNPDDNVWTFETNSDGEASDSNEDAGEKSESRTEKTLTPNSTTSCDAFMNAPLSRCEALQNCTRDCECSAQPVSRDCQDF